MAIGTIFSVFPRFTPKGSPVTSADFLQQGIKQIAAGYIIYRSSSILVYATRRGINGFMFDPSIAEFTLSLPDV